jgi:hypothetical protein
VVDRNYNIIYADMRCQGHISDGGVFHSTILCTKLEKKTNFAYWYLNLCLIGQYYETVSLAAPKVKSGENFYLQTVSGS